MSASSSRKPIFKRPAGSRASTTVARPSAAGPSVPVPQSTTNRAPAASRTTSSKVPAASSSQSYTDTVRGRIPTNQWVSNIQKLVDTILAPIEPDRSKRNRFLTSEAMKLWVKAFTHQSVSYDANYRVLETFGDRVLALHFMSYTIKRFPNLDQEGYTNLEHDFQKRGPQGDMSEKYGLSSLISIKPDAIRDDKLYGDVFEAFYGALSTIGDLVLPGLGGVMCFNLVKYMYDQEDISLASSVKDAKSTVVHMFNRFRYSEEAKSNYFDAGIRPISGLERNRDGSDYVDRDGNYIFVIRLPPDLDDFLRQQNVIVDPAGQFTDQDGNVIVGEGKSPDASVAEKRAYAMALEVFTSAGFTSEVAKNIKRLMDFEELNPVLVKQAEQKAQKEGLILLFATSQTEENTVELKGQKENGQKITLASAKYDLADHLAGREEVLRIYLK